MVFRPDPDLDQFRNGAARLLRDGEVVGHVTTYTWRFRSLANFFLRAEEGVWLRVTWSDGSRTDELEDYGPDWPYVAEMRRDFLVVPLDGVDVRFDLVWLSGEERLRAWGAYGRDDVAHERIEYAFRPAAGPLSRAQAVAVCASVLDHLRDQIELAEVDAHSDFRDDLPPAVEEAQTALRVLGAEQGRRDTGMAIRVRTHDDVQWALLREYAAWSIHVQLWGRKSGDLGTLHDCAHSLVVNLTPEERALLDGSLAGIGRFVLLADARRDLSR